MQIIVVFGSGTDVGKTFITSKIINILHSNSHKVYAIKPVISGYKRGKKNDLYILAKSFNFDRYEDIALYKLKTPISPNISADIENIDVNFQSILDFCIENINKEYSKGCKYFFIETAGGLLSPICNNKTCLDLLKSLEGLNIKESGKNVFNIKHNISSLLVASNYLGTISHSQTALHTISKISKSETYFLFNDFVFNKSKIRDKILSFIIRKKLNNQYITNQIIKSIKYYISDEYSLVDNKNIIFCQDIEYFIRKICDEK